MVNVRRAIRAPRPREPSQEAGDPCGDCGTVLALCVRCGVLLVQLDAQTVAALVFGVRGRVVIPETS